MTLRVALLAASIFALTPLAQAQEARRVLGGEHLRVHYWPRDEALAQLARETGERALVRLQGMLAAEAPRRIDVYIVASQAEFDDLTGGANDPWIIGRALPSELRVVVKPMGPQRLPGLLAHELATSCWTWRWAGRLAPALAARGHRQVCRHDFDQADRQVIARAAAAEAPGARRPGGGGSG